MKHYTETSNQPTNDDPRSITTAVAVIMKTSTVAQTAFLLALAAGPGSATRYSTTVKNFGVKFKVLWWDDGRDEPYRMAYTKKGIYSVFKFNAMGELQSITVEGEDQNFSTSRKLIAAPKGSESSKVVDMQENVEADERELDQEHHRRRLYACSDCENTWNTLCNTGLADVCAVWSSGALKGDAKTAVKLFCKKFNKECDAASAEETCADDCTEGEVNTYKYMLWDGFLPLCQDHLSPPPKKKVSRSRPPRLVLWSTRVGRPINRVQCSLGEPETERYLISAPRGTDQHSDIFSMPLLSKGII